MTRHYDRQHITVMHISDFETRYDSKQNEPWAIVCFPQPKLYSVKACGLFWRSSIILDSEEGKGLVRGGGGVHNDNMAHAG